MDVRLSVPSLTCGHCAAQIEPVLIASGVTQHDINIERHEVQAQGVLDLGALLANLKKSGFDATVLSDTAKGGFTLQKKLLLAWICTLPLLLHMVLPHWAILHSVWLHFILATPVMVIGVLHFGPGFISDVKQRSFTMDSLILIGSSAAYLYSLTSLFSKHAEQYLFFESAASIIAIVLLGSFVENRALRKAVSALKRNTVEGRSLVRRRKGTGVLSVLEEITAEDLLAGDHIAIGLGEQIPTDAVVITGTALIDASIITGESDPIEAEIGSTIPAGAKVIQGTLELEVTAPLSKSTLAQIEQAVQKARLEKPAIQELGDAVASVFVPLVVIVALATIGINLALGITFGDSLLRAVAVLVVACPCAIGLAIPAASANALGTAAHHGIIIKSTKIFSLLRSLKVVILDKTGTLTERAVTVTKYTYAKTQCVESEQYLLSIAHALASLSMHPLSRAIAVALHEAPMLELQDASEQAGVGIHAKHNGENFHLGRPAASHAEVHTTLYRNGAPEIYFETRTKNREYHRELLSWLQKDGIKTILASGDSKDRVQQFAKDLNFSEVKSDLLPAEKENLVRDSHVLGTTMMIGDGINDASALAKADIGVSFTHGVSLSQASSQVVLLGESLKGIQQLIMLGRKTDAIMRQNLFWAFLYNSLAIPIAACGLLSPTVAAFTMAASDIVVLGNSLRLRRMPTSES